MWTLCGVVSGFVLTKPSARLTVRHEFHGEGDNTGDYMLSGLWELTSLEDVDRKPISVDARPSWSGNSWPGVRVRVPEVSSQLVALTSRGYFRSPPNHDGHSDVRGSWSCDGADVTLARFGLGSQVVGWYTGKIANSTVRGYVQHGAHSPEFAGYFTMMPFEYPRKREVKDRGATFNTSALVGHWSLTFESKDAIAYYDLELRPDLTWRSTDGLLNATIGGKWNVFDENMDLGSGIQGQGGRMFLWLQRFGTSGGRVSTGVHLNADELYIGKMHGDDASRASRVTGTVALGWSVEPAFIGRFFMVRRTDDDPGQRYRPAADDDDDGEFQSDILSPSFPRFSRRSMYPRPLPPPPPRTPPRPRRRRTD